jgi:hypothetical protein
MSNRSSTHQQSATEGKLPPSSIAGGAASNASPPAHRAVLPTLRAARERQLVLLQALESFARQQRALMDAEDVSPLPEILNQRQLLIDELLSLDAACVTQALQVTPEIALLETRVRDMAQRLHEQDKEDLAKLQERVKAVAQELGELRSSGRALGAYAGGSHTSTAHSAMAQDTTA